MASTSGKALAGLVERLAALKPIGENLFRGQSYNLGFKSLFGGQPLGQSLQAAALSLLKNESNNGMVPHSLHAYFLRPGDAQLPVDYEVQHLRDGANFSARHVTGYQNGLSIFSMTASFQKPPIYNSLDTHLEHQTTMPCNLPQPEDLESDEVLYKKHWNLIPEILRMRIEAERALDFRPIDPLDLLHPIKCSPSHSLWMRANGTLPATPLLHYSLLAYASDLLFLATALRPHGVSYFGTRQLRMATISHSVVFHRPFWFDDWLLYTMDSPSAAYDRGYVRGMVFNREGQLVASTNQEGMLRMRGDRHKKD